MKQRPAMIIATVLTAFVLVIVGGVIARLSAAPAATTANNAPAPGADADLIATYQQRELELQQQILKANEEIARANDQLATAEQALNAPPESAAPLAPAESLPPLADPGFGGGQSADPLPAAEPPAQAPAEPAPAPQRITAEQAVAAALAYVGGGTVERVKLEQEHGALVYEVRFTNDNRVYVDPVSGVVVYAKIESAPAATASGNNGIRLDDERDDDNSGSGGGDDDDRDERDDDNSGSGGGDDDRDDDDDD